jgi:hypothetical protein
MLLADKTDGYLTSVGISNCGAERSFAFIDTVTMMTQSPVPEVGILLFSSVEPIMNGKVVFWQTSPSFSTGYRMMPWSGQSDLRC